MHAGFIEAVNDSMLICPSDIRRMVNHDLQCEHFPGGAKTSEEKGRLKDMLRAEVLSYRNAGIIRKTLGQKRSSDVDLERSSKRQKMSRDGHLANELDQWAEKTNQLDVSPVAWNFDRPMLMSPSPT